MNPIPIEGAALAVARAMVFVREEPVSSNRGQAVEAFLKTVSLGGGHPWCAAFVAHVGKAVLGGMWPLPLVAGCASLGDAAQAKGLLRESPEPGDIFLLYYPKLKRFAHTGFVTDVRHGGICGTIEGNTSGAGVRDGWGVFERERTFGPNDRFIRWREGV